ncbi:MAM domain containing protein, partial [Asbolus verrucosus]
WKKYESPLGKISENFTYHYKSTANCINNTSICDITQNCLLGDETQNCDRMPYGARCTFEEDWYGWYNVEEKTLEWSRHNGSTPTNYTGPNYDHTYMNSTCKYLYVNMLKDEASFASSAALKSVIFNSPPRVHGNLSSRYYNSCAIIQDVLDLTFLQKNLMGITTGIQPKAIYLGEKHIRISLTKHTTRLTHVTLKVDLVQHNTNVHEHMPRPKLKFILVGASGDKDSGAMGSSRGAMVRVVIELRKGQEIYMLVGQEGTSACVRTLGHQSNSSCLSDKNNIVAKGIRGVPYMDINDGGGGGGGATYVFLRNKTRQQIPIAIAAGGGGLGLGRFIDTGRQHGQAINMSRPPVTGRMSAGAGGSWKMFTGLLDASHKQMMGRALLDGGGIDGKTCYNSTTIVAMEVLVVEVEGTLRLQTRRMVKAGSLSSTQPELFPVSLKRILVIMPVLDLLLLLLQYQAVITIPDNRYQHRASGILRRKMLSGADLQLDRIRVASDSMMTEYNRIMNLVGQFTC